MELFVDFRFKIITHMFINSIGIDVKLLTN